VVSSHTSSDLATSAGRDALKAEVLSAARRVLGDKTVLAVYLTDFTLS
jgi:flagellar basal body-associated protein FliL